MYKYVAMGLLIMGSSAWCAHKELPEVNNLIRTIGILVGITTPTAPVENENVEKCLEVFELYDLIIFRYILMTNGVYIPYSHEYIESITK